MAKHRGPTPPSLNTKLEKIKGELNSRIEELEIQNRSFALCLSAMVHNFGNYDPDGGSHEAGACEYVLRLKDFQAIGDTELLIETKAEIEGEAGTVIIVQFRKKPEESVTDGEAQEKSGS